MLELTEVSVSYGAIRAVRDVSLRVDKGETVALIGANGAGENHHIADCLRAFAPGGRRDHAVGQAHRGAPSP